MNSVKFLVVLFLLVGNMATLEAQNKRASSDKGKQLWKQQVEMIKSREKVSGEQAAKVANLPQLVDYKYRGKIKTAEDVKEVKAQLMSDDSYFPVSGEGNADMKLMMLKEIKAGKSKKDVETFSTSLAETLNQLIQVGSGKVELEWKYGAKTFKTLCVVSEKGIVYDNIIVNLLSSPRVEEHSGPF